MTGATPRATYRVQLRPDFGFDEVSGIARYLARLGVSHVYLSPVLQAMPGSSHGYDVVDPTRASSDLGGPVAHQRMSRIFADHDLGQVLDVVPNHMAVGPENPWWLDVLENGAASRFAAHFDVDWDPSGAPRRRILIPILGDHYGRVLAAGELRVERDRGAFWVRYFDNRVPVAPRSLVGVLAEAAEGADSDDLRFLAGALGRLPPPTATDRPSVERRHRDKMVLRRALARLLEEQPTVASAVDAELAALNADVDALDDFLGLQNYRLAWWRSAGQDLGYRRFFDVTSLIGLRMEDPTVFADTHELILRWLADGTVDGLRIDHPDGLRDPERYLERLRAGGPDAWIVVEKILEPGERLPERWPVQGTTGYEFLRELDGLLVDGSGARPLARTYAEFTGERRPFARIARESKRIVIDRLLGSELNRLTEILLEVCERHRVFRDFGRADLAAAVRETAASFPVYRSYVPADASADDPAPPIDPADRRAIEAALAEARAERPDLDAGLWELLGDLLLLRRIGPVEAEFVARFQQFTGPVMAKGVEDTAFYRYHRLVSLNEVGGDPAHVGLAPAAFHRAAVERQRTWPAAMLTTSTHDTKRAEDVRARLHVLSEVPDEWREAVIRWRALNQPHRRDARPDRNLEYLLYQTLVGTWPIDADRLVRYLEKAAREAKTNTSWTDQDLAYEEALERFARRILRSRPFVRDLEAFVGRVRGPGRANSLALALIRLTAPGIPDTYQGTELWDLSLVDPDNRRPVDFAVRERLLEEAERLDPAAIPGRMDDGLPKLWLTSRALRVRARFPAAFGPEGSYRPLRAGGPKAAHAVAYVRGGRVVVVVTRLSARLGDDWAGTTLPLPGGPWTDQLTGRPIRGGRIALADLLDRWPVALLARPERARRARG